VQRTFDALMLFGHRGADRLGGACDRIPMIPVLPVMLEWKSVVHPCSDVNFNGRAYWLMLPVLPCVWRGRVGHGAGHGGGCGPGAGAKGEEGGPEGAAPSSRGTPPLTVSPERTSVLMALVLAERPKRLSLTYHCIISFASAEPPCGVHPAHHRVARPRPRGRRPTTVGQVSTPGTPDVMCRPCPRGSPCKWFAVEWLDGDLVLPAAVWRHFDTGWLGWLHILGRWRRGAEAGGLASAGRIVSTQRLTVLLWQGRDPIVAGHACQSSVVWRLLWARQPDARTLHARTPTHPNQPGQPLMRSRCLRLRPSSHNQSISHCQ
jgi:hypothetical protein